MKHKLTVSGVGPIKSSCVLAYKDKVASKAFAELKSCCFRFASVTVNLGPTFLSGALAANAGAVMDEPSCPLVQV